MKDPLEDSEILHSGEGGDVDRWLESRNNFFVFAIAFVLLSIIFTIHTCVVVILYFIIIFIPSLSLSVYTHLNKEAIEHLNSLSRGIKEEKF